jgi:K+-transporting ATPase KdpF subunit
MTRINSAIFYRALSREAAAIQGQTIQTFAGLEPRFLFDAFSSREPVPTPGSSPRACFARKRLFERRATMIFDYSLAAIVSAGLLFYLTYALLRPERF